MDRFARNAGRWMAAAAVLLLAACATGPRVTSDVDPSANFAQYRTFAFYTPLAIESQGYATLTSGRTKDAARAQMEARGYVYDEKSPDLWVNLNAYMQEKTGVVSVPEVDYDYYYSYRARRYVSVPYWRDRTDVYQYTEGTLNVDLVDARENRLVWTGVAVGRVGRTKPEERGAKIDAAIAEIYLRYPYRAGSGGASGDVEVKGNGSGIAKAGIGFGTALAITISWSANKSLLWAVIHGVLSWIYVIYYALVHHFT